MVAISLRCAIGVFLFQALQQVVSDPQRIGDGGQRRVDRADAGEKTGVHDVKIVQLVGFAVDVEHGLCRVGSKAAGA